jgi:hypothetical protein
MAGRSTVLVLFSLLAVGCSHQYQLIPFNAAAAPLQRSRSKRVAVVLVSPAVQDVYETSTDGHSFTFENGYSFVERLFGAALGRSVGAVQTFRGQAPTGFDAYIFPELSLEASGMLNHTCSARFTVSIKDPNGRIVARNQKTSEDTFAAMDDAGRACTTAITAAFNGATYPALAALDSW